MLRRLQKKTLIPAQIIGYTVTLLVGVTIVLLAFQLYSDVKPLLTQQTDVFKNHAVTLSKNVRGLSTAQKSRIYFDEEEIENIRKQRFVKDVALFRSSTFETQASIRIGAQGLYTDLFFESVPDNYIDVTSDEWKWDPTSNFIPIIIPEDYLSLYNFGFAESQSLPVISKGALEQVNITIDIRGNGRHRRFDSRVVGFSGKINTILTPDAFLSWANEEYGSGSSNAASRLLIEFSDASDETIPTFIEQNDYNIKQDELETSKRVFFFKLAIAAVLTVAIIIIVLSVAFIVMSLNLIVQRNRDLFVNLYGIGYSPKVIARFYQQTVSIITAADMVVAIGAAVLLRNIYVERLSRMFQIDGSIVPIIISALALTVILIIAYNIIILRTIKNTVEPARSND
jgi:hypothetical protein